MSAANLTQTYQPSTFLERGVAMPFTTPMLAGARARPDTREGLEVILPNPSGGRGVYILPWPVCGSCAGQRCTMPGCSSWSPSSRSSRQV